MWGTNHEFFEGRQRTAFANGDHVDFPSSSSASYSDVNTRYPVYSPSENSVNTLTANEAMHILKNGDIHWDENIYWIADKHLWKNGAWILRKNKIPNYSQFSFEGQDYDRNGLFTPMDLPISQGKPTSNVGDYYFLPALGELVLERSMFIDRGNVIYTATKNLSPLDDNNYILLGIRNGGDAILQNINRTTRAYPKYVFE